MTQMGWKFCTTLLYMHLPSSLIHTTLIPPPLSPCTPGAWAGDRGRGDDRYRRWGGQGGPHHQGSEHGEDSHRGGGENHHPRWQRGGCALGSHVRLMCKVVFQNLFVAWCLKLDYNISEILVDISVWIVPLFGVYWSLWLYTGMWWN